MRVFVVQFTRPDTGKRETLTFSIEAIRDKVATRLWDRGVWFETWEGTA